MGNQSVTVPYAAKAKRKRYIGAAEIAFPLTVCDGIDGGQKDYSNSGGLRAMYIVQ